MMADEPRQEAVLDEPGRAVRALKAMTASAAQSQRRVAAAVQEQERLLTRRQSLVERRDERRRQEPTALDAMTAHIDELNCRQLRFGVAARQMHAFVPAARDIDD